MKKNIINGKWILSACELSTYISEDPYNIGAAYLYGLEGEQLLDAQGIVLSQASASLEFLDDGAWTKRNHPAWASACGQTAAMMAKHGYFGPGMLQSVKISRFYKYLATPFIPIRQNLRIFGN